MARPTLYDESFVERAQTICQNGGTTLEVAQELGVSERTVQRWAKKHPEFCRAVKVGKEPADDRVEMSLYARATGYVTTETRREYSVHKDGNKIVRTLVKEEVREKHVPPDVAAAFIWLKNRRPEDWRDRREFVDRTDDSDGKSNIERARRLVFLLRQVQGLDDDERGEVPTH